MSARPHAAVANAAATDTHLSPTARQAGTTITNALDDAFSMIIEAQMEQRAASEQGMEERIMYLERKVEGLLQIVEGQSREEQNRKKQHAKALGQRIVLRMKMGSYLIVWDNLLANVQEKKKKKAMGQQAMRKMLNRSISSAFTTWRAGVASEKLQKQTEEGAKHHASVAENFKRLGELEEKMEEETAQRHYEIGQVEIVLRQMEALMEGKEKTAEMERQAQVERNLRQILNRMKGGVLSKCWYAWKGSAQEAATARAKHRKALNLFKSRDMAMAFGYWQANVRLAKTQKKDADAATNFQMLKHLSEKVDMQSDLIEQLVSSKAEQIELRTRVMVDAMVNGLSERDAVKKQAQVEVMLRRTVMRMKQGGYVLGFQGFLDHVATMKAKRAMATRATHAFKNRQVLAAFGTWRSYSAVAHKHKSVASINDNFRRLGEIEGLLQAETEQRHYEVAQINLVLKQIEDLVVGHGESVSARHKSAVESRIRSILFRMNHDCLGQTFCK